MAAEEIVDDPKDAAKKAEIRAATSVLMDRLQFLRQAGVTFGGLRDLYDIFGYDRVITPMQYRDRYARGGIAGRVVDLFPMATWRGDVNVVEDDDPEKQTDFEKAWTALEQRLKIKAFLLRADILSQLSTFSVLLLGAPGKLDTELPKGRPESLQYLQPYSGAGGPGFMGGGTGFQRIGGSGVATTFGEAKIATFETDVSSPRFGYPNSYQLSRTDVGSAELNIPVHWSRIIHLAEGCLDNEVYGQPRLERVWNLLDDLEKVTGGGSEAFFLRANQGLHIDIDKDLAPTPTDIQDLKDQATEYQHQMRRILRTRGTSVEMLGSDTANFSGPADVVVTQIAGSLGIPKRVLTGSEMGELASSQDRENWQDQVNGRQKSYAEPYIVRQLVDRLIKYGYLPTPKKGPLTYGVKWPHLQILTEKERAEGAEFWSKTNQQQGETVFTGAEIRRKWYDMAPLSDADKKPIAAPQPTVTGFPKAAGR